MADYTATYLVAAPSDGIKVAQATFVAAARENTPAYSDRMASVSYSGAVKESFGLSSGPASPTQYWS